MGFQMVLQRMALENASGPYPATHLAPKHEERKCEGIDSMTGIYNSLFMELGSILDPGRPPKMDKAVILSDAVRMVLQLQEEAQKLIESNENLQEKINELKAEKNELRDEKQRLKVEKENLEQQVKATELTTRLPVPPTHHSSSISCTRVSCWGQGGAVHGLTGVPMWQFLPLATVDTSQDHVHRPPVASGRNDAYLCLSFLCRVESLYFCAFAFLRS